MLRILWKEKTVSFCGALWPLGINKDKTDTNNNYQLVSIRMDFSVRLIVNKGEIRNIT
jgi:hypothetical protein